MRGFGNKLGNFITLGGIFHYSINGIISIIKNDRILLKEFTVNNILLITILTAKINNFFAIIVQVRRSKIGVEFVEDDFSSIIIFTNTVGENAAKAFINEVTKWIFHNRSLE